MDLCLNSRITLPPSTRKKSALPVKGLVGFGGGDPGIQQLRKQHSQTQASGNKRVGMPHAPEDAGVDKAQEQGIQVNG